MVLFIRRTFCFLALFLSFTNLSYAAEWYRVYFTGSTGGEFLGHSVDNVCGQARDARPAYGYEIQPSEIASSGFECRLVTETGSGLTGFSRVSLYSGDCPPSLPYEVNGICYASESDAPAQCESGADSRSVRLPDSVLGSGTGAIKVDINGCEYEAFSVSVCGGWSAQFGCLMSMRQTGESASDNPDGNDFESTEIPPDKTNDLVNEKTTDSTPPVISASGDNTVEEFTTSEESLINQGFSTHKIGNNYYLKDSTGAVVDIFRQHEIITYPTNNKTEIITETTSATPSTVTQYKVNPDGTVTTTQFSEGRSGNKTTTSVTNYDASGNVTGSSTASTGELSGTGTGGTSVEGDGVGDGDDGSEFCSYARVVCDVLDWFTDEPDSPDHPEIPELEIEIETYTSSIGGGSCPANIPLNINFPISASYEIDMAPICELAVNIRPFTLLSAYLLSAFILIGAIRR